MSLRVWLPLNGNADNKGASDVATTVSGAAVNTGGKIGSCYSFDGNDDYIALSGTKLYKIFTGGAQPFSIAMWVYHADATRAILFGDFGLSGTIEFNVELATDHKVRFYWGGGPDYYTGVAVAASGWSHIAITYSGTEVKTYLNGTLAATRSGALATRSKTSGDFYLGRDGRTGTTALNGRLNDFRIYDHCLSTAEVRELSQALVLHYKMDQLFGLTDIIVNPATYGVYNNYSSSGTTGSLTNLNETFHGAVVRRETMTPNDSSITTFRTNLHSHGVYGHNQTFLANTKYVFWIYFRPVTHGDMRVGGVASNVHGWTEIPPVSVGNGWYRVGQYRDGSVTENKTDAIFTSFYTPSAESGVPIIIDWASPHLLQGTTEIPEAESFESEKVIRDSSGYGRHATMTGTFTSEKSSGGRYGRVARLPSGTNYGYVTLPAESLANSYTFAFWGNSSSTGVMPWGFGNGNRLNLFFSGKLCWNTGDSDNNPFSSNTTGASVNNGVWHHYAVTGNGSVARLYIDGVDKGACTTYRPVTGTAFYISGWNDAASYKWNGLLSDLRIYATALSADDVKALYNVSARIDKAGGIHAFEFTEAEGNALAQHPVVNNSATSFTYDSATDTYTVVSPVGTSTWGYGLRFGDSPQYLIPYNGTCRWSMEVFTPTATTLVVDYNNYAVGGDSWSGNDNDLTADRLSGTISIPANTWTKIIMGTKNANASNTAKLPIRDASTFGLRTDGMSAALTWKIRNIRWYLVDDTAKPQVKKNGQLAGNILIEGTANGKASFGKRGMDIDGTGLIER